MRTLFIKKNHVYSISDSNEIGYLNHGFGKNGPCKQSIEGLKQPHRL
jgi:hypothetical protein